MNKNTHTNKENKHICPICKGKQIYIMHTWVCIKCNRDAYEDLRWCERWIAKNMN